MAVIGKSLQSILGHKINIEHACFNDYASAASNKTLDELIAAWRPVVSAIFPLLVSQLPDDPTDTLRDAEKIPEIVEKISAMALAINLAQTESIKAFVSLLPGGLST